MKDYTGHHLGNYHLKRSLGRGGCAEVYLGEHIHLHTLAAIKILHVGAEKDHYEHLYFEANTVAQLHHPHIICVRDFHIEGEVPFLVMDYASGGSIRQHHLQGICVSLDTIVVYTKQVAAALQYAHDRRIIHRDVKPENILLGAQGEVLLSDFGIATLKHSTISLITQDLLGTPLYMAPEQILGKPRPASDQYALGVVIYEWLCGTRPFEGTSFEILTQHLYAPPPSLREKMPSLPLAVEEVILRALAKEPEQRFSSVQAFAEALEQASKGQERTTISQPSEDREQRETLLGQHLGNYRTLQLLGSSGFSEIYLGEHQYLERLAAIKVLHVQMVPEVHEVFRREARILAQLQHPHIMQVYDFGIEGQVPYLAMEYAPKGTLRSLHPRGTRLSFEQIITYIKQIASALQYAHNHSIVHLDVKPENLLLNAQQDVLLGNFGLAMTLSPEQQNTYAMAGTLSYIAPEQARGNFLFASDQYALAIVTYEWLCGKCPFEGSGFRVISQHLQVRPPSLRELRPELPADVEAVVLRALAKEPQRRFASVQSFAQALEHALSEG